MAVRRGAWGASSSVSGLVWPMDIWFSGWNLIWNIWWSYCINISFAEASGFSTCSTVSAQRRQNMIFLHFFIGEDIWWLWNKLAGYIHAPFNSICLFKWPRYPIVNLDQQTPLVYLFHSLFLSSHDKCRGFKTGDTEEDIIVTQCARLKTERPARL